jgi:glucokinase
MPESSQKSEYYVGVDFGGTKILAGVFDAKLNCLSRAKVSTKSERGVDAVIGRIVRSVSEAVDECDLDLKKIRAIGLGAPGAVNSDTGCVIFAPNLKWRDVPLKEELQKQLGVPVYLENDGNICTLGVYETELTEHPKHVLGVFIGTGVGGGLIVDGKLYHGANRTAGEIGHMVVQVDGPKCGCGNRGCFEALASRTAIFKRIEAAIKEGQETLLTEMLGKDLKDLRSGDLRKAIKRGDKFVAKVVSDAARVAGIAVGNFINIFNPETVILGGGVIDALENEMMPIIAETAQDFAMEGTADGIKIFATKVGDDAGILGAAVLARNESRA